MACFAQHGHHVVGVDVNPAKIEMINAGRSPIIEDGVTDLIQAGVQTGHIRATTDVAEAVGNSQVSMICVGTPSHANGSLNLDFVRRVCDDIGRALAHTDGYHVVVARSTMLPGSTEEVVIPALEQASGKRIGVDFGVCYNPEFLREGSSVKDFYDPPYTVIGGDDERAIAAVKDVYSMLSAPVVVVPFNLAEIVKYTSNTFHALKVAFANEIGNICKQNGIDSHRVMEIFCRDTKLNLSPHYLKPGYAFGGSCLPKDLRALLYHSRRLDISVPVLESILNSNRQQVELACRMIEQTGRKRVGVLGFSFKAGTDDLRESPVVSLIEYLIGKGYQVRVYDRNVSMANLHGANRTYIEQEIPHIASLMVDTADCLLEMCDVVVIGNQAAEFREVPPCLREDQLLIDLMRIVDDYTQYGDRYQGICW